MKCEDCNFWQYSKTDEYAGKIGTCRYNPPSQVDSWNMWPRTTALAWCGKFEKKS